MKSLSQKSASTGLTTVLAQRWTTARPTAFGTDGQPNGTFLRLIGEDARAFAEYQSMLRQLSSPSSPASDDLARLKKLPRHGAASVTGARRPCRVI